MLLLVAGLLACSAADEPAAPGLHGPLVFAAVEGDGVVAVVDGAGELLARIDLASDVDGMPIAYFPHNVQGAPDGQMVWATAHPGGHAGMGSMPMQPDQLIGIDVARLSVVRRIPLGVGAHAAHVVIDGGTAWVTAWGLDALLEIDLAAARVVRTVALPVGAGPHGTRLAPDGSRLFVAGMGIEGALLVVDAASGSVERHPLPAPAVQVAVLPDGSAAFATLAATAQVARLDRGTSALTLLDLPPGAAGPAQIYPSPAGDSVWVAEQGVLLPGAAGHRAWEIDAGSGALLRTVELAEGPHGIVVEHGGARAWTTSAAAGLVQSFDTATGTVGSSTFVGSGPNGITCVHPGGAMP